MWFASPSDTGPKILHYNQKQKLSDDATEGEIPNIFVKGYDYAII